MKIEHISTDVLRLSLWPLDAANAYVLGDILVDSGGKFARRGLLSALSRTAISGHVVTHAHFDHQGSSHAVCEHLDIPFMCGEGDRTAVETGDIAQVLPKRDSWLARLAQRLAGPGHPVARSLREGDEVGGFVVIETPGHTPGHLAFWRESDGVLVVGDVLFHRNPMTMRSGLREPFAFATFDPGMNRRSARKLAALEPAVVCFGHGEPLRATQRFAEFVSTLRND
ncbi:MAG: MBL fold metallo-hydrolase [Gemmatimonadota bacterium]|nr:MBL fold metallo-hydrolase [Gemmatimonadota bacterium]MDH3369342.1 MBL fold metallo-hydrolase [Gemmatimonadota bacterium]MDH3479791.1 MBL fold metallo-hydrolase [Gemmatimonadota bacterium]MDH3569167.1 MBL fold metallo-hydrolase [Gemmatimonadota bacterium]MDH5549262.1 MBL fold metallo-hydrolase [Gemmatimonadota bacterium]